MIARALLEGLVLGAGLIIPIGAQNAFVLRRGLAREHVLAVVLVCVACDAALIAAGIGGVGTVIASSRTLTAVATWGGAAFLFVYGLRSFHAALRPGTLDPGPARERIPGLGATVLLTLGVSLLNPHVYLDTVVVIGSVGGRLALADRLAFGAGAIAASTLWFFSLGFGAARLSPLFRRPRTWRVLDVVVGALVWSVAAALALNA